MIDYTYTSSVKVTYNTGAPFPDINVFWSSYEPSPLPPEYVNDPIARDCFVLEVCLGGRGILQIDDKRFPIEQGQAFIIYPDVVSREYADAYDPWHFAWCFMNGDALESFFKRMGVSKYNPILPQAINKNIYNHLYSLADLDDKKDDISALRRASLTYALFTDLLVANTNYDPDISSSSFQNTSYVNAAIQFIHANYFKKIKVSDIADHLGLNRSYFFSLFKKSVGVSPQEFLIQFRMKKACNFFMNPHATVTSVAYSVGYDPTVFSQIFKKTMGVSPSAFRTQLLEKQKNMQS